MAQESQRKILMKTSSASFRNERSSIMYKYQVYVDEEYITEFDTKDEANTLAARFRGSNLTNCYNPCIVDILKIDTDSDLYMGD